LALPFNASIAPSTAIVAEENEENCPFCDNVDSNEAIYFNDLKREQKEGIIVFTLLYMIFESDIEYFDSLDVDSKTQYLNSYVTKEQLFDLKELIYDDSINKKLQSVLGVTQGNTLPFSIGVTGSYVEVQPSPTPYAGYKPGECWKFITVPILNVYNNIVKPSLEILGYVLTQIALPTILEVAKKIIEVTPNVGLLIGSTVLGILADVGWWIIQNIIPIIVFIIDNSLVVVLKTLSITGFVLWITLFLIHVVCKTCFSGRRSNPNQKTLYDIISVLKSMFFKIKSRLIAKNTNDLSYGLNLLVNNPPPPPNNPPTITNYKFPDKKKINIGAIQNFYVCAVDPDNDNVSYCFDWGTGGEPEETEYYASGTSPTPTKTHSWLVEGEYTVKIYAKDELNLSSEPPLEKTYTVKSGSTLSLFKKPFNLPLCRLISFNILI
jgi:hypothetical protein